MWTFIVEAVIGALKAIFGLGGKKEPSATDLAASNATAETELAQKEAENETLRAAAEARAAADARIVRESAQPSGIDADPDGHWRD